MSGRNVPASFCARHSPLPPRMSSTSNVDMFSPFSSASCASRSLTLVPEGPSRMPLSSRACMTRATISFQTNRKRWRHQNERGREGSHRAHSNTWRIVDRDKSISLAYLPRISTASSAMLLIPGGGAASLKHRINHLHDSADVHVTKKMMRTKRRRAIWQGCD